MNQLSNNPPVEISRGEYIAAAINSIKQNYPDERQDSKPVTFALQYLGTWMTLVRNCGFPAKEAKSIEKNYHDMYQIADAWVQERLKEAAESGYITAAFGLRVRTPLLEKTILGGKNTPYEAAAEGRTAGNAIHQSWCLLNSRAANEFMERVWASPHRLRIRPSAQIHDACYMLIDNDTEVLHWVNINLIECMQWQEDPLLAHPTVKLGAELDVFWPDWSNPIKLNNGASLSEIRTACVTGARAFQSKAA